MGKEIRERDFGTIGRTVRVKYTRIGRPGWIAAVRRRCEGDWVWVVGSYATADLAMKAGELLLAMDCDERVCTLKDIDEARREIRRIEKRNAKAEAEVDASLAERREK